MVTVLLSPHLSITLPCVKRVIRGEGEPSTPPSFNPAGGAFNQFAVAGCQPFLPGSDAFGRGSVNREFPRFSD